MPTMFKRGIGENVELCITLSRGADSEENQGSDDPSRQTTLLRKGSRNLTGARGKPRKCESGTEATVG